MKQRAMDLNGVPKPPKVVGVMVLLDCSGSMRGIKDAMTQEFANWVAQQQTDTSNEMWLTLCQFDSDLQDKLRYVKTYERTPIANVLSLGLKPVGNTPLRDALVRFATEAKAVIDDQADDTERLLLVIITDGEENRSRLHSWAAVREAIAAIEGPDCELIFMGTSDAILQAEEQVQTFAAAGASFSYQPSGAGVVAMSGALLRATSASRSGESARGAVASYMVDVANASGAPAPEKEDAEKDQMVRRIMENMAAKK